MDKRAAVKGEDAKKRVSASIAGPKRPSTSISTHQKSTPAVKSQTAPSNKTSGSATMPLSRNNIPEKPAAKKPAGSISASDRPQSSGGNKHATEIEQLKASHQAAITALESAHQAELEKAQAELDQHRTQSLKLEDVETKIHAVEEALRESKAQSAQREQALLLTIQKKDEDGEQLAAIVDKLKDEIDRCQVQLDADVAKQEELRQNERTEADKVQENLQDMILALRQQNQVMQQQMTTLQAQVQEKQEQNEDMQQQLQEKDEQIEELQQQDSDAISVVKDLEAQLKDKQGQLVTMKYVVDNMQERLQEKDEQIEGLQQQDGDALSAVKDLERQLQDYEEGNAGMAAEYKNELQELRSVMENMQVESEELRVAHRDALEQKEKEAESMKEAVGILQEKLFEEQDAHENDLKEMTDKHAAQAELARMDAKEISEMRHLAEDLQNEVQILQHELHDEKEARLRDLDKHAADMAEVPTESTSGDAEIVEATRSLDSPRSLPKIIEQLNAPSPPLIALEDPVEPQPELEQFSDASMTLEGTLESLRIQTEQLLEVHDDFWAENQRVSWKLGMRSNDSRASPLQAAA